MKIPNAIEDEIDRIRLQIYEETKDMTPAQHAEYTNKSSEAGVRKLGFRFIIGPDNKRWLEKIPEPTT